MKKSTLALSIAAAVGSFGLVGTASAGMSVNADGIGHQLVFPYFTTQGDNATLLSLTNTDTANGKLVKVRFRGAANSDDLFDFQLALSPGDMWTAALTQDAATGKTSLSTTDKSCTLPATVMAQANLFSTGRLDPSATDANKAAGTREGYVEVITMGDINGAAYSALADATTKATSLYKAIKHVSGIAPCTADVLKEKLGTTTAVDLAAPTRGIAGDWIILNQKSTAAWSGAATALVAATPPTAAVFYPQLSGAVTLTTAMTADPLFTSGIVAAQYFDLPDMSTAYDTGNATAVAQANDTTSVLAVKTISNQYVTNAAILAVTDYVMAQPTRRYHVAVNYTGMADDVTTTPNELSNFSTKGTKAVAIFRNTTDTVQETSSNWGSDYYRTTNTAFPTAAERTLCVNSITSPGKDHRFNREELTPATATTDFTISPVIVAAASTVYFCGEAPVISINAGTTNSALSATVARRDITYTADYTDGWLRFSTAGAATGTGLPIVGGAFIRASNGTTNYGFTYSHKVTR